MLIRTIILALAVLLVGAACDAGANDPPSPEGTGTEVPSPDEPGSGDDADAGAETDTAPAPPSPEERFGQAPAFDDGEQTVRDAFEGVRWIARTTSTPRPLNYHVVLIDPAAEGIDFRVTPANGEDARETTRQTTLTFVNEVGAQLGINGHFFRPWPAEDAYADVIGLSASDGDAYSPFQDDWERALVVEADGDVAVVRWAEGDDTGYATEPPVEIDDALGAQEQIITAGENTADWEELHPRTAAGVTDTGLLVLMVVDGRQDGTSEGMTTPEVADVMLGFGVVDAINLDGGGSSTLVVADPDPRVVNRPVGYVIPGTERDNGSNLAIFASPRP